MLGQKAKPLNMKILGVVPLLFRTPPHRKVGTKPITAGRALNINVSRLIISTLELRLPECLNIIKIQ